MNPRLCAKDCGRQADERRDLCRRCYLGATAVEKAGDDWTALHGLACEAGTEPIDSLELWFALPARDHDEPGQLGEAA